MQRFSLPEKKMFDTCTHLNTVKHLLRLFSGLKKQASLKFHPPKKTIYARESHCRQTIFLSTKWETEERQVEGYSNQIRSLFLEPVTNATLGEVLEQQLLVWFLVKAMQQV